MLCPMYTIKRAAEVTGVAPATLRAWERRYGVGRPTRTESGYRLYDEGALGAIRSMQMLLDAGWAPRQAAAEVLRLAAQADGSIVTTAGATVRSSGHEGFLAAASAMDDAAMRRVLDDGFASGSFEQAFDQWMAPALRALGEAWVAGRFDIAAEHFASAAVMRRLSAAYEAAVPPQGAARVLVGLVPGAFHEVGALAFATAAKRAGIAAVYVGANLPEAAWLQAIEQEPVAGIALSLARDADVPPARSLIAQVRQRHPLVVTAVGGACAAALDDLALVMRGGVADSAQQLLQALHIQHQTTRR